MQELDGKLAELACARHAMSMNVRINDMLSRDDISFLGTESSHEFRRIAAMTAIKSFEHKHIETLDIMVESIEKALSFQSDADAKPILVKFSWSITRNKVQGMRNEEFAAAMSVEGGKVVEVNELDVSVEEQQMQALRLRLKVPDSVADGKFAWIISFFCTFPSDYAFDILSEKLNI